MDRVLSTLLKMPGFIIEMFTEHLIVSVAGVMIFLLALIVPGRIGSLIRKVVILGYLPMYCSPWRAVSWEGCRTDTKSSVSARFH